MRSAFAPRVRTAITASPAPGYQSRYGSRCCAAVAGKSLQTVPGIRTYNLKTFRPSSFSPLLVHFLSPLSRTSANLRLERERHPAPSCVMARRTTMTSFTDMQVPAFKVRRVDHPHGPAASSAARFLPLPSSSPSLMRTCSPDAAPAVSSAGTAASTTSVSGRLSSPAASISLLFSRSAAAAASVSTTTTVPGNNKSSIVPVAKHGCGAREFGGKFAILEPLEASALYRCLDKESLQEYVCKVVPTQSYHDYLSGYLRMNGNPGINTIESVFVGGKQTHILFKPSHGDLHSYVRSQKRLSEPEAIRLFHQIAVIVNECHENGICLRDLKLRKFVFRDPEKTLLKLETLDDAVVLEDADDDLLGEKHGCPVYASPEILSTVNGRYSGRGADCWSLGVILFTMLVGRYPFHDTNPTHLFGKIRRGLFQIPNSISPLARVVINSLLRKDPNDRMTTEDLLASQLFSAKFMQQQHPADTPASATSSSSAALSFRSSGYPQSIATSILLNSPLISLTSPSSSSSASSWHETI